MNTVKINGKLVNAKVHWYKIWKLNGGYKKVIGQYTHYILPEFMHMKNVTMFYV